MSSVTYVYRWSRASCLSESKKKFKDYLPTQS